MNGFARMCKVFRFGIKEVFLNDSKKNKKKNRKQIKQQMKGFYLVAKRKKPLHGTALTGLEDVICHEIKYRSQKDYECFAILVGKLGMTRVVQRYFLSKSVREGGRATKQRYFRIRQ